MTLFLTNLEIPIVTTALISITNDLHHFGQDNWIISAYMLGYVSMYHNFPSSCDIDSTELTWYRCAYYLGQTK